jgi:type II restriction/modification system DNA methylase subunit YeeA
MNKAKLKSYAPQARKDFIAAVTARANLLGISDKTADKAGDQAGTLQVAPAQTQGDVTVIAGQAWPAKVSAQRDQLIERIRKDGFAQTMEAVAYTWFNRFAALRYMELHDYLGHGHRALSSAAGTLPDILNHAADLAQSGHLLGLQTALVTEMKLVGNRDGELYRMLLVAQCNALSRAMPFLFERIDDDSELLLPNNLLRSDSVIAKLVEAIPEEDWAEVEIIGWLYQFYISEKKDQVIGKVVKSEDIPAATQLFTPNWIVQYLVQNSVGRLWLMANPQSTLASEWPYYITPAEQTPEVQAQLDALIQTRVREDGDTLNPETITVLDPACGSGHILVVAYDVLKAIYLERGYQPRAIPRLILEKNLFGLDIDDRAAQMAGFALLMKARADDRRLFTATDDAGNLQPPKLNVLSLQESKGLDANVLTRALSSSSLPLPLGEGGGEGSPHLRPVIQALIATFEHAKTFGSLIQIPYALKTHLAVLPEVLTLVKQSGDMYATAAADDLLPLVQQAQVLAMQFDAVVANPPYIGGKGMNGALKEYADKNFPLSKADVFAMFIERCHLFGKNISELGFVTPYVWMFIATYEAVRDKLITEATIKSLIQLEYNAFEPACVPVCTFVVGKAHVPNFMGSYIKLSDFRGHETQAPKTLEAIRNNGCGWFYESKPDDFKKIPGSPIAYWVKSGTLELFTASKVAEYSEAKEGLKTGDNNQYLRYWHEVGDREKWRSIVKGGRFRKWYGNIEYVVNWAKDGDVLRAVSNSSIPNKKYLNRDFLTWSNLTSGSFSMREVPGASLFETKSPGMFSDRKYKNNLLGFYNSKVANFFLQMVAPTLDYKIGPVLGIPFLPNIEVPNIEKMVDISRSDWNAYESSVAFQTNPLISIGVPLSTLKLSYEITRDHWNNITQQMQLFERENNKAFISGFDLTNEVDPEVPLKEITLTCNPNYRFAVDNTNEELEALLVSDTAKELISYAIGCMMGRYSLDAPGLIYAHAGNVGFEPGRYATFPADADGIIPITDELWFADDAPSRIREFLRAVWGDSPSPQPSPQRGEGVNANMAWLAESLGTKATETPDETIRRYIADKFFKDHLQTYKKRPIYWLFSSGKQGAFQALVYLHRYNESTLARLRAEYVVPLTGKIQSRIEMLQKDTLAASSTAARNKLAKEVEKLKKKHVELLAYDEQLRHHADMRITLDLDDGVKVNYGKFGDLLAEVKAVTGGASDD